MIQETIQLEGDKDVVAAWKSGLSVGRKLGFGSFKQACLSGAILELSRNLVDSGGRAVCVITDASDAGMLRAQVVIETPAATAASAARQKLQAELNIAPGVPRMKLQNVVESCDVQSREDSARIVFTVNQARAAKRR